MRKTFTLFFSLLLVFSISQTTYARELTEWEPDGMSHNDTPADALSWTSFVDGDTMDGRIHSENDDDWFHIVAPKNCTLTLKLTNIPKGCDYDLSLWNVDGVEVGSSTYKLNKSEKIEYEIRSGLIYYIKVYSSNGYDTKNRYRLSVDLD